MQGDRRRYARNVVQVANPAWHGVGECTPDRTPDRMGSLFGRFGVQVVVLVLAGLASLTLVGCSPTGASSQGSRGGGRHGEGARSTAGVPVDPTVFAAGACVSFAPTAGDHHHTVFIDAGHGGIDPGAQGLTETGQTIYEADETLPVELDAMALLRSQGYRVVVSRTRQTTVLRLRPRDVSNGVLSVVGTHDDVAARDLCANKAKADVLVGIYFDAGTSTANAGCLSAYDTARPFAAESKHLATLVQTDVLGELNAHGWQIPNDGAVEDGQLGSIVPDSGSSSLTRASLAYDHLLLLGPAEAGYFEKPSEMPGTITEPLYLTDPFEGSIANSEAGQQAIAHGIAEAVTQYFGPRRRPTRHADRSRRGA